MKKTYLLLLSFLFVNVLFGQMDKEEILVEETTTTSTSYLKANDLETFKNQFDEWSVGNLHLYGRGENTTDYDYYFTGKKVSPYFQQYFPNNLKKSLVQDGNEPHHVALIRGHQLDDYYIIRIKDEQQRDKLIMYNLRNEQLNPKKDLAYFYEKNGKTYQLDSWIQDINGDTRLDIIQKKRVTDANGNVKKQKTKVFFQTKNGKFKRTRRANIQEDNYKIKDIK
ncbi:MAG: hypothetical protein AAF573_04945 [Bacteroidota bacterium]